MTHSIRVQVGPCYPRCPRSAECVALLSFGQRIVPSRGTGVMARLWLTRPQAHGVQVYTARTREAVVSSKMFESLVSRCLVVERLKVQSTQPVAAVAKLGRNCTRLAARFGHKLSRELLNCWSSCCTCGNACAAARHRASSGAPSAAAAGTGANLCTKTACAEACAYTKRRERKRAGRHALHRSCAG